MKIREIWKGEQRLEIRGGGDFIYNIYWSLMRSASVLLHNAW